MIVSSDNAMPVENIKRYDCNEGNEPTIPFMDT